RPLRGHPLALTNGRAVTAHGRVILHTYRLVPLSSIGRKACPGPVGSPGQVAGGGSLRGPATSEGLIGALAPRRGGRGWGECWSPRVRGTPSTLPPDKETEKPPPRPEARGAGSSDAPVDHLRLLGDAVPTERGVDRGPPVPAHPAAAVVVADQGPQAPGHRLRRVIDVEPVDLVPDELGGAAPLRAHHGLVGRPPLEDDDPERLVAAGHRHDVARLEQVGQLQA